MIGTLPELAPLNRQSRPPKNNPIRTYVDWQNQRQAFLNDPGAFHGAIARQILHWYDRDFNAWITWDETQQCWIGLQAQTGVAVQIPYGSNHEPWRRAFNADNPPFYHWFEGGLTNACFNEVDRHVLMGYEDEIAFYFEGDRWDSSRNYGRGGPLVSFPITRKRLLLEVVKAAQVLRDLGLHKGDRIALNMPNILEQIYYTEAAKRLGIIYTSVFGGFSDKTLSDRLHNAGARVVITRSSCPVIPSAATTMPSSGWSNLNGIGAWILVASTFVGYGRATPALVVSKSLESLETAVQFANAHTRSSRSNLCISPNVKPMRPQSANCLGVANKKR